MVFNVLMLMVRKIVWELSARVECKKPRDLIFSQIEIARKRFDVMGLDEVISLKIARMFELSKLTLHSYIQRATNCGLFVIKDGVIAHINCQQYNKIAKFIEEFSITNFVFVQSKWYGIPWIRWIEASIEEQKRRKKHFHQKQLRSRLRCIPNDCARSFMWNIRITSVLWCW